MKLHSHKARWELIDRILEELLDATSSQRETILRDRCGADTGLRLEIEKLLAATETTSDSWKYQLWNQNLRRLISKPLKA
jgi:hypothetical protein